jgi:hypothetical protein
MGTRPREQPLPLRRPMPVPTPLPHRRRIRAGPVVAFAVLTVLVVAIVWLFIREYGSSNAPITSTRSVRVSLAGLRTLAGVVPSPIYWVGPQRGRTYELTKTDHDLVWIRYLPPGVAIGSDAPYLFVGTYPMHDAFDATSRLAQQRGSVKIPVANGGVAYYDTSSPNNIYLAYPGVDAQIEVYDPSAGRAQQVVASGQVQPVTVKDGTETGPRGVSSTKLKTLASSSDHPIYWAGNDPGVTYELWQTSDGSVFVRYLPRGVPVGAVKPYLTVGTYPLHDAFTVTKTLAQRPGMVRIEIGGGAIAFFSKTTPTNVYLAYPGVDVQIEVYDPSPTRARGFVASQRITPVG